MLRMSRRTVYYRIREGRLPHDSTPGGSQRSPSSPLRRCCSNGAPFLGHHPDFKVRGAVEVGALREMPSARAASSNLP